MLGVYEDLGPVVQREVLKKRLVQLRHKIGKKQREVATALEWSEAKVMRVETGKTALSKNDLEGLLRFYGVTGPHEIDEFLELSRRSRADGWWNAATYRDSGVSAQYMRFLGYEAGASSIWQSHNSLVPALLQTEEYARVITRDLVPGDQVEAVVRLRMQRQEELRRRDRQRRPEETYILDEAVIRRHVGVQTDPGLMVAQIYHLIEMNKHHEIHIHIIPFDKGYHAGLRDPFTILKFPAELGIGDIAYLEPGQLIDSEDRVASYNTRFILMLKGEEVRAPEVLNARDSQQLLKTAAEEMARK